MLQRTIFRWALVSLLFVTVGIYALYLILPYSLLGSANLSRVKQNRLPTLTTELARNGFQLGAPVFLRIFKQEKQLEIWIKKDDKFQHYKNMEICTYSGDLGPKLKEGDGQSPEGFYYVTAEALNPNSSYHLSFNLGFPNAYDRSHGRTGSYLMIHGNCVSIGCYAMTNEGIEEIYLLVEATLSKGQSSVPVHIFPFRMTSQNLQAHQSSKWSSFWQNLKQGYDAFETTQTPPHVTTRAGQYYFEL